MMKVTNLPTQMIDSLETPIGSQKIEVLTGSHSVMLCHQQIRIDPLGVLRLFQLHNIIFCLLLCQGTAGITLLGLGAVSYGNMDQDMCFEIQFTHAHVLAAKGVLH
jgi:hypothetical protein